MKKPVKPRKPSKNASRPSQERHVEYSIYRSDSSGEYIFREGELTEEELEQQDFFSVYSLKKDLILTIAKRFSAVIDYTIEYNSYDNAYYLETRERIPDFEYTALLKEWNNRFKKYEEKLKLYEVEMEKYNNFLKDEKIVELKKRLKKLEGV